MKIQRICIFTIILVLMIGLASGATTLSGVKVANKNMTVIDSTASAALLDPVSSSLNDFATFLNTPINTGGGPKYVGIIVTSSAYKADPQATSKTNRGEGIVTYYSGALDKYDQNSNSMTGSGSQIQNTNIWTCTQVCSCNPSGGLDVSQFSFNPKMSNALSATVSIGSKTLSLSNGESVKLNAGPTGVFYGQTSDKVFTVILFKYIQAIG